MNTTNVIIAESIFILILIVVWQRHFLINLIFPNTYGLIRMMLKSGYNTHKIFNVKGKTKITISGLDYYLVPTSARKERFYNSWTFEEGNNLPYVFHKDTLKDEQNAEFLKQQDKIKYSDMFAEENVFADNLKWILLAIVLIAIAYFVYKHFNPEVLPPPTK